MTSRRFPVFAAIAILLSVFFAAWINPSALRPQRVLPGPSLLSDDIAFFPIGPEFKLKNQIEAARKAAEARRQAVAVPGDAEPQHSRIDLTFSLCGDDNELSLMLCESLLPSDQLKGKRLRMGLHILWTGEYDGEAGTLLTGCRAGMSSHPQLFEIPTSIGTSIAKVDCIGPVPFSKRISVEWLMEDENDLEFVARSSVYRVSATRDRNIKIIEEEVVED